MTTTDYVAAGRSWASELFKNPLSIDHPAIRKLMEDFKKTIPEPSVLDGYVDTLLVVSFFPSSLVFFSFCYSVGPKIVVRIGFYHGKESILS